jgi:hypothetical protein
MVGFIKNLISNTHNLCERKRVSFGEQIWAINWFVVLLQLTTYYVIINKTNYIYYLNKLHDLLNRSCN